MDDGLNSNTSLHYCRVKLTVNILLKIQHYVSEGNIEIAKKMATDELRRNPLNFEVLSELVQIYYNKSFKNSEAILNDGRIIIEGNVIHCVCEEDIIPIAMIESYVAICNSSSRSEIAFESIHSQNDPKLPMIAIVKEKDQWAIGYFHNGDREVGVFDVSQPMWPHVTKYLPSLIETHHEVIFQETFYLDRSYFDFQNILSIWKGTNSTSQL